MTGKSKKTEIVSFRLDKDVLAKLKKGHPDYARYLRDRVTYDVTRSHRRKKR